MRVITIDGRMPASEPSSLIFERFLRDRAGVWQQIGQEYRLDRLIREMLLYASAALACYGAVMGLSNGLLQALSAAIKLPVLFLLTLAICLPTLYLSNLLFGGRLTARQVFALLLSAITIAAVSMLAFAPITFFFLLTAQSYQFFVLLNVVVLALTSAVGLRLLVEGVRYVNTMAGTEAARPDADGPGPAAVQARPANVHLLQLWLLLYAFVGTQLGWTLRPFFGAPGTPFHLFRPIEGSFYESIIRLALNLWS